jgi:ferredoxin-NADP reductase
LERLTPVELRAPGRWQVATVTEIKRETPSVKSFRFAVPMWMPHLPGQHYDIRLTDPDGYHAQRSYSVSSSPLDEGQIELTIDLLDDGEVSPYFHEVVQEGDQVELRGPFTSYFVWRGEAPVLLVGGGSGVVPLMAMLRHRATNASAVDARLLVSARSPEDVFYRAELESLAAGAGLTVHHTFTRQAPAGWSGFCRRVDAEMLCAVGPAPTRRPRIFVCGPTAFVERAADLLITLGHEPATIRTERFGPTGG